MADVNRGVSTAVGYVLNLAVATLLVTALLTAAGGFVDDQHDRVVRSELRVIGERIAADLATADRLARASDGGTVRVTIDLPPRVAGTPYRIRVDGASEQIVLSTRNPTMTVRIPFESETGVESVTHDGGRVIVVYDGSAPLEVRDGD